MISRTNRFHGYNSLNHVYRKGKAVRGDWVSLRYIESRNPDYRLAVVVSKKVNKSAVVRNRIRRRIYEIVRVYKKESPDPWPRDMIISVFDDQVATTSFAEFEQTVRQMLQKSGL